MTQPEIAPVTVEIVVDVPQAFAFETFTKQTTWWPMATHHIGSEPAAEVILEPRSGGRWFERDAKGNECEWGDVLVYDPVSRILLGWHLKANWQYDKDFVTEVEVLFIAEGPEKTRVTLEHRNLDRYGEAAEKVRASIGSDDGWGGLLKLFASATSKG